jgi:hypothetical protein
MNAYALWDILVVIVWTRKDAWIYAFDSPTHNDPRLCDALMECTCCQHTSPNFCRQTR